MARYKLKEEIETWLAALAAYDHNEFDSALSCFDQISDTSKILFNIGVINATLGEHTRAVESYQRAIALDQYLAVAYFQQGVSNFLMGDFEEALANFNDTLLYLRGNKHIDYAQLGLTFKLFSCEVLFNRGLCYIYLQQKEAGMQDLIFAAREKVVPDHDVIDEAIKEHAEGYTVFSIPVGVVYRPNEAKVRNLKRQDYLGRARLVAEQTLQQQQAQQQGRPSADPRRSAALAALDIDDRPQEKLSYAALNLVKSDLRSRARQQSEPPLNRNIFPPTPPPELERQEASQQHPGQPPSSAAAAAAAARRRSSVMSGTSTTSTSTTARQMTKPPRLELGAAAFDQRSHLQSEKPRLGTKRSESERPRMRNDSGTSSSRGYDGSPGGIDGRHSLRDPRASSQSEMHVRPDPLEAYSPEVAAARMQQQTQQQLRSQTSTSSFDRLSTSETVNQYTLTTPPHNSTSSRARTSQQSTLVPVTTISEESENEDADSLPSNDDANSTLSPLLAFEIIAPHPTASSIATSASSSSTSRHSSSYHHLSSSSSFSGREGAAATAYRPRGARRAATSSSSSSAVPIPEMRKIRLKVHAEDMRYVMTTPGASFGEVVEQVRLKLGLPIPGSGVEGTGRGTGAFKLKIKDEEGDLVMLADQDDWEMAVATVKANAAKERVEMGKLEVWVQEV